MSPETEDQRNSRIRDAQMQDRTYNTFRKPLQNITPKNRSVSRQANKPLRAIHSDKSTLSGLPYFPPGGLRDVMIGFAYGLIPTLLVAILLPGALKLLALLVLGIAGAAGYLLGEATS